MKKPTIKELEGMMDSHEILPDGTVRQKERPPVEAATSATRAPQAATTPQAPLASSSVPFSCDAEQRMAERLHAISKGVRKRATEIARGERRPRVEPQDVDRAFDKILTTGGQ